jgi:beta-glucanase (GH16 family)
MWKDEGLFKIFPTFKCTIKILSFMKKMRLLLLIVPVLLVVYSCVKDASPIADTTGATNPNPVVSDRAGICNYDLNESTLTSAGWTKIFEDNFTTNLNLWNIWTGGAYNNELQCYEPGNLSLANGILSIAAVHETVTGPTTNFDPTPKVFNYTSGRIESKTLFSANNTNKNMRLMARLKLPAGYGMWPAFWSYGDPWPTQGEIDVLEARGQEPFKYQTNYFYGPTANNNIVQGAEGFVTSSTSLTDCWHVVDVVWSKTSLTFSLDGVVVKTNTGGSVSKLFGKQEKLVLNLAVGGLFFNPFDPSQVQTGTLQVDWVKVFKKN